MDTVDETLARTDANTPDPGEKTVRSGDAFQRSRGRARLCFGPGGPAEAVRTAYQQGSAKIRFPKPAPGLACEAVLLNTSGGLTGGDRFETAIEWTEGAQALVTSQAAERIYRSAGGVARVVTRLTVGGAAKALWLPQETILFDRAAFSRRLEAHVAGDADLLLVEAMIFGRTAMGETVETAHVSDQWRIRRDGQLVFADGFEAHGRLDRIGQGPATLGGCRAFATVVHVSPDAESRLDAARACLEPLAAMDGVEMAASAWNGLMSVRFLGVDGQSLRAALSRFLEAYCGRPLPRVWTC